MYAGSRCDGEAPAYSHVLLRPDLAPLLEEIGAAEADFAAAVEAASLSLWVARASAGARAVAFRESAGPWDASTTLAGLGAVDTSAPLASADIGAWGVGRWDLLELDVRALLPRWLEEAARAGGRASAAGVAVSASPAPGAPACADARVALASFAQAPGDGGRRPLLQATLRVTRGGPAVRVLHPAPGAGGYLNAASPVARLAVDATGTGFGGLECSFDHLPYGPCPAAPGSDPAAVDLSGRVRPAGEFDTVSVRALSSGGVPGEPAAVRFAVDDRPPAVRFAGRGAPATLASRDGSVRFEVQWSDEGSGVALARCMLDPPFDPDLLADVVAAGGHPSRVTRAGARGGAPDWAELMPACTRHVSLYDVERGAHVFVALAVDRAGNVSPPLVHRFSLERPPTARLSFGVVTRELIEVRVAFDDPVDALPPGRNCLAINLGTLRADWYTDAAPPRATGGDGREWLVSAAPTAEMVRQFAARGSLLLTLVPNCVTTRDGTTVAPGPVEARVPADFGDVACSAALPGGAPSELPARYAVGDVVEARFGLSKRGVAVADESLVSLLHRDGAPAGSVVSVRVEGDVLAVEALPARAGDVRVVVGTGALRDPAGNVNVTDLGAPGVARAGQCVTPALTVVEEGRLGLLADGRVVRSPLAGAGAGAAAHALPTPFLASPPRVGTFKDVAAATTDGGRAVVAFGLDGAAAWTAAGLGRAVGVAVGPGGEVLVADAASQSVLVLRVSTSPAGRGLTSPPGAAPSYPPPRTRPASPPRLRPPVPSGARGPRPPTDPPVPLAGVGRDRRPPPGPPSRVDAGRG